MRMLLRDLSPGTAYSLQIRTTSDAASSEWSRKFEISTDVDNIAPSAPTSPVIAMSAGEASLSWSPVTTNADGTPITDLSSYKVTVKSPASGQTYVKDVGLATNMEFSLDTNRKTFGSPKGQLFFEVVAIDSIGNQSVKATSNTVTTPAPANVTGLTASPAQSAVDLKWNVVNDPKVTGYRVYMGTTSGFTPATPVAEISGNVVTIPTSSYGADLWFKVVAVDLFGITSATPATAGPVRPTSPFTVDTVAPATPGGLAAVISGNVMTVSWNAVSDSDLRDYIVSYRRVGTTDWEVTTVPYDQTSTAIPVASGINYNVRIRAGDMSSNTSNYSSVITTTTATVNTAPAVPTGLSVVAGRDDLQIKWNENTEDDMKNNAGTYDVTVATNSGFTTGVLQYKTGALTLSVNGLATSTQYWVRVRATDNGNPPLSSAYSSSVTATTGAFPTTALSDGNAPASSPTPTVVGGFGYIHSQWPAITNNDMVVYEVHVGTTSGFATSASTKVSEVAGTTAVIETTGSGSALAYGTTYYVKIIAKDRDGAAAASAASAGVQIAKIAAGDTTIQPVDIGAATQSDLNTKFNATIKNSVVEYAVNSSESTAPTSGWSTATPTRTAGSFIWYRTVLTFGDNTSSTSNPALLTGNTGATGSPGTPAPVVSLTATTQVLASPSTGGATSPATSVVTGTALNTTITAWTYSVDGAAFSSTVPAGVSRSTNTVTITGSTMTAKTIAVKAADAAGNADTLTVAKVFNGAPGADGTPGSPGAAGADAYTVILTNESQTFAGSTTAALAGSTTSGVIAYKGGTQIAATIGTITGQVTGLTTAISNNGTTNASITVTVTTALTTKSGELTIPVTVDGKPFTKKFSWALSLQGATGSQGIQGPPGADGSVTYTWLKYADTPTTGMSDSPTGKTYMGIAYNKTTATESSVYSDYEWSLIKGADGADGKGVSSTSVTYQAHTNGTTAPTGTWQANPVATTTGQFLWTRTVTTYTDSSTSTAYSVSAHGATGSTGSTGAPGRGISSTAVTYQVGTSGTTAPTGTWLSTVPATSPGQFLWTRTITTFTSAPLTETSYSVAAHGATGSQGIQGPPGANGQPTYTWIKYATSSAGAGMSDDPTGKTYIGIAYNKLTQTESSTASDYVWSLIQGPQGPQGNTGSTGPTGVSVTSVTPYFTKVTKGASAPAAPTTSPPPGPWSATEPTFSLNTELYRVDRILYSNSTFSYTAVTKVSAYDGADAAIAEAQDLANTAKSEAITAAADDATTKADGVENRTLSRGTDLVTNGTGYLKNNYNFPGFTFNGADAPVGANGSFVANYTHAGSTVLSEMIPYNPGKAYQLAFSARQTVAGATNRIYGMLLPYDAHGASIAPSHYMFIAGTTTTLAQPITSGDTKIYLTSASGWYGQSGKAAGGNTHLRSIIWWDYIDPSGKAWAPETYSRNHSGSNYWADGGISGNVITLNAPYSGPTRPAGTKLSNGTSGGSYVYMPGVANVVVPEEWTTYSAVLNPGAMTPAQQGVSSSGAATWTTGLPPSTGAVKVGWLLNYAPSPANTTVGRHAVASVSFSDASAANYAANNITETQITDYAITTPKIATDAIDARVVKANAIGTIALAAEAVDATKIKSNSITTKHMAIGDTSNMVEINESYPGTVSYGDVTHTIVNGWSARDVITGQYFMFRNQTGPVPFKTGDRIRLTFEAYADAAVTAPINLWLYGNTSVSQSIGSPALTTSAQSFAYEVTITADTNLKTSFLIGMSGVTGRNVYVRNMRAYVMNAGELIVDGSIHGNKITTNTLSANAIATSTLTSTTITLGSGGVIQSTGFSSTAGFQLSTSGLIIRGSGSTVDAGALKAGTITATTINIGATGTLNVDSTGQIKSNNYALNSTGYKLSNAGLEINDGSVDAKTLKAGSALINEIVIGATPTGPGGIKSNDYVANSQGFKLSTAGLEINKGSIAASTLKLQYGQNLMHPAYADFEYDDSYYSGAFHTFFAVPVVDTSNKKFGTKALKIVWTGNSSANVHFSPSDTSYNISIDPSKTYIVSAWVNNPAAFQMRLGVAFLNTSGTKVTNFGPVAATSGAWTRLQWEWTPTVTPRGEARVFIQSAGTSNGFTTYVDGVQIEEVVGASGQPASTWTPPSSTTIDGGAIRTGSIQSNALNSRNAPYWSINMSGNAVFNRAEIHESLYIGDSANPNNTATVLIRPGGAIISGDPLGARIEQNDKGIKAYTLAPNGSSYEATTMTTEEMSFRVIEPAGSVLGGIASDGAVTGSSVASKKDMKVKGVPLLGKAGGGTESGWLDNLPRGLVRSVANSTNTLNKSEERFYLRTKVTLQPGRRYRVVGYMMVNIGNVGALRCRIRYATGGALATESSTLLWEPSTTGLSYTANVGMTNYAEGFISVSTPTVTSFAFTYEGVGGGTPGARKGRMYIEDVGPEDTVSEEANADKTLFTTTWRATASRNYTMAGAAVTSQDGQINQWYWHATPNDFKPAAWLYGGGAAEATDTLEMGKTLSQALTGATIERVQVYLKNQTFYSAEKGKIVLGSLGGTSLGTSGVLIDGTERLPDMDAGEGAWLDVPKEWFTNGANTGITLGDKDGKTTLGGQGEVPLTSGVFDGINDDEPPLLKVTYLR